MNDQRLLPIPPFYGIDSVPWSSYFLPAKTACFAPNKTFGDFYCPVCRFLDLLGQIMSRRAKAVSKLPTSGQNVLPLLGERAGVRAS